VGIVLAAVVVGAAVVVAVVLLGGSDSPDDEADVLEQEVGAALRSGAEDVIARLDQDGIVVDERDIDAAEPACPRVFEPAAGDRATCSVVLGDTEVSVEVEFGADSGVTIVAVAAAP